MDESIKLKKCPCGALSETEGPQGGTCQGGHWAPRKDGRIAWEESDAPRKAWKSSPAQPKSGTNGDGADDEESGGGKKESQSERLIKLGLASASELFIDQHGAPFALVDREPINLNSGSGAGGNWLRRLLWEAEGKPARGESLSEALGTLRSLALYEGTVHELHVRAAWHEGTLYYELGPGRVVKVMKGTWMFDAAPPVLFRHYPNAKPLPHPAPGGSLDALGRFANLHTDRDRRLLNASTVVGVLPHIPRAIGQNTGPMGSGKSFMHRIQKRLLDPTIPETIRLDPRDALQKCSHCYIVMLDNASSMSDWGADLICRLVTGEGDSKRRLYSDDDDQIYEVRRWVLLNNINVPSDRADVQDRTLPLEFRRIPKEDRIEEAQLWAMFERGHPQLLGAVFDTLALAMDKFDSIKLPWLPRLADWGRWMAAVYEALGWGAEQFLADWGHAEQMQEQHSLDGSLVGQAVLAFMRDRDTWQGTSTALHQALEAVAEELQLHPQRNRDWPKSPIWLWRRMRHVSPVLSARGVSVHREEAREGSIITLSKGSPPLGDDPADGDVRDGGKEHTDAATAATTATGSPSPVQNGHVPGGSKLADAATAEVLAATAATTEEPLPSSEMEPDGSGGSSGSRTAVLTAEPMDPWDGLVATDEDGSVEFVL